MKKAEFSKIHDLIERIDNSKALCFCRKHIFKPLHTLYKRKFLLCVVSAIVVNLIIEMLGRWSLEKLAQHIIFHPHFFLYGTAFICLTFCLSMFFRQRFFVYAAVLALWLGLGIGNARVLTYRSTPMISIDFQIMRSSISLSTMYLSIFEIVLIILLVIVAVALLAYIYRICKREKVNYKRSLLQTISVGGLCIGMVVIFSLTNAASEKWRLPEDYTNCGYVYCLTYSLVDVGIDKPEEYDEEYVKEIQQVIDSVEETAPEKLPNIVYLQLESFMDMYRIDGIELSENPHPYFSSLKEEYPNGKLTVNALGACTANVEYEVLTGTDIRDYGFDEYPYKSYLDDTSMESIAYNLKKLGYTTTSMHNHNGGFYGRYEAYANLGFDRFIPKESMGELTDEDYTAMGWVKDDVLIDQIMNTLSASDGSDFIMTVTVQCHSKYPTEKLEDVDYPITVGGFESDEEYTNMLSYYALLVQEEDAFLKELLEKLSALDEDTLVVMYGDHLPTFISENEQLVDNGATDRDAKYDSEYIIWYTEGMAVDRDDKDIEASNLSSYALDSVGIRIGNIMRLYHAEGIDADTLREYKSTVAYDILEGRNYFFDGKKPYETIDMDIGLQPVTVTGYELKDGSLFIQGLGFTPSTYVYINDNRYSTEFISDTLLEVTEQVTLRNRDTISVKLFTYDLVALDESDEYKINDLPHKHTVNKGKLGLHFWILVIIVSVIVVTVAVITLIVVFKLKKRRAKASSESDSSENKE